MYRLVIALLLAFAVVTTAKDPAQDAPRKVDIDLARMSGTMVYAQVYQMVMEPAKFVGKRIRMRGIFSSYYDEETKTRFFGCIIKDALACCSQGLAFELEEKRKFPDDFPDEGAEITIVGDFDFVDEEGAAYPLIRNAEMLPRAFKK